MQHSLKIKSEIHWDEARKQWVVHLVGQLNENFESYSDALHFAQVSTGRLWQLLSVEQD